MKKLRAAIVGAGLMGRWHAAYVPRVGAAVAALVDPARERAVRLQRRHKQAIVFSDLQTCLGECPVDVVHVCTSLASHVPLAESAMQAGKHVLVEKPLARTEAETQALLDLARNSAVRLGVVHQFPWQRGFRQLVSARGRLGDLVHVLYHACTAGGEGRDGGQRRDILLEILPHPFSLFCALFGTDAVGLTWKVLRFTDDDLTVAAVHGRTELLAAISLRGRPTRNELTVIGTRGTAYVDLFHGFRVMQSGTVSRASKIVQPVARGFRLLVGAGGNLALRALRREPAYPGLRELLSGFYRSVGDGSPPPGEAEGILATARWIEQVRKAG